jgi:hypothetical protein
MLEPFHYLTFKSVPVVIEPCVAALEVSLWRRSATANSDDAEKQQHGRVFYVQFERVDTAISDNISKLPFIVSSNTPHIFSMANDIDESPFLLVYSFAGKLDSVYTRDPRDNTWSYCRTIPEQTGDIITQPSIRFVFKSTAARNKFLKALGNVCNNYKQRRHTLVWGDSITKRDLTTIINLLSDTPAPVVFPIAVENPQKSLNV